MSHFRFHSTILGQEESVNIVDLHNFILGRSKRYQVIYQICYEAFGSAGPTSKINIILLCKSLDAMQIVNLQLKK
jgi:hypothetical protein